MCCITCLEHLKWARIFALFESQGSPCVQDNQTWIHEFDLGFCKKIISILANKWAILYLKKSLFAQRLPIVLKSSIYLLASMLIQNQGCVLFCVHTYSQEWFAPMQAYSQHTLTIIQACHLQVTSMGTCFLCFLSQILLSCMCI